MKSGVKVFIVFLTLCFSQAGSATNRRALVEAVYQRMPVFIKFVKGLSATSKLVPGDQAILNAIDAYVERGLPPLEFDRVEGNFDLEAGEANRLMRTRIRDAEAPVGAGGAESEGLGLNQSPIYVNETLLSHVDTSVHIGLLVKLFFHELGRQVGVGHLAERYRVGQFLEDELSSFVQEHRIGPTTVLEVLSLPASAIQSEFVKTSVNLPQPTYLVLLKSSASVRDLTPAIDVQLNSSTSLLRAFWSEANRAIFEVFKAMREAIHSGFRPIVEQITRFAEMLSGGKPLKDSPLDFIDGLTALDPKELRILDLFESDVRQTVDGGEALILLRGIYRISRTDIKKLPINVNGFEFRDDFPAPIVIQLDVPLKNENLSPRVSVQLRPDIEYGAAVKVGQVLRQNDEVKRLKVIVPKSPVPQSLELSVNFPAGHILLPAKTITDRGASEQVAEFEMPPYFTESSMALWADSVLFGMTQTRFLDRVVTIRDGHARLPRHEPANQIVPGSLGFWGLLNGEPTFKKDIQYTEPMVFLDNLMSDKFSVNPSQMVLEFDMARSEKIRQIRIQFRRNTFMMDSSEEPGELHRLNIDGKVEVLGHKGKLLESREFNEIVAIKPDHIYLSETSDGRHHVTVRFRLPFRKPRDYRSPNEAATPPLGNATSIEIVTENLTTIRQVFGQPLPEDHCEFVLNPDSVQSQASAKTTFTFE